MHSKYYLTKNDAMDSIENFKQNSEADWVNCVQTLIASKPFGDNKFYIFMFIKRVDDSSGVKKMYHQPRLTKPEPVPGSTLLRVDPNHPDEATIIWTLPNQENFNLYKQGKFFADEFVHEYCEKLLKNPKELMKPEPGDLPEHKMKLLWIDYLKRLKQDKLQKKLAKRSFIYQ